MHNHQSTPDLDHFWVVAVISNPVRYRSRYELFKQFKAHMDRAGVNLMIVEVALGNRTFEVTEAGNPHHLQLRTHDELWHKENMINLGIQRLPADWKYVAWVDADIEFVRPDWARETVEQLQHYHVVQMFQTAIDLGPQGEAFQTHQGFMFNYHSGLPLKHGGGYYNYPHWHPGYCWAARREAIDALGGLYDTAILGAGDHHMAWALLGKGTEFLPPGISDGYRESLAIWEKRAMRVIDRNVGYVPGTILHHWHGKKRDRRYRERWGILKQHNFDPEFDLKRDWQGLLQFSDEGGRLRNDIRAYFRSRNEDSIDLE
jgi:hypothetical protein